MLVNRLSGKMQGDGQSDEEKCSTKRDWLACDVKVHIHFTISSLRKTLLYLSRICSSVGKRRGLPPLSMHDHSKMTRCEGCCGCAGFSVTTRLGVSRTYRMDIATISHPRLYTDKSIIYNPSRILSSRTPQK